MFHGDYSRGDAHRHMMAGPVQRCLNFAQRHHVGVVFVSLYYFFFPLIAFFFEDLVDFTLAMMSAPGC